MTTDPDWTQFLAHSRELSDLGGIGALLGWDQSTHQPPRAAAGRSRQQALLSRIRHARGTDASYGQLLERLSGRTDLDPVQTRSVALAARDFGRSTRLPGDFVAAFSEHAGQTYTAWTLARPEGDFARMQPLLERTLDLSRQYAGYFPEYPSALDFFVDDADEGMTVAQVDAVFAELKTALVPLVEAVTQAPAPRTDFLGRHYPAEVQLRFGSAVIKDYGYDFGAGRQDLTHHPFMTRLGDHDVRITTRVREDDPTDALYSTLHEAGHAMYEQGVADELLGTPLGGGVSAGVHESQSRLWENLVGRSRAFWSAYGDDFRAAFPDALAGVGDDELYRASNTVARSLIRTDADELTYNLHVIIRYELERQLLSGELSVRELPDAWQASYQAALGVQAPDHRDGVLQDVHWYGGRVGGVFQGYTLGNVLSAQFYAAAEAAHPGLEGDIAGRQFARLRDWLREHVYAPGGLYTPAELVQRATGQPMSAAPYLAYLRGKYTALYGV
jgi:carboxypeptidase Taq